MNPSVIDVTGEKSGGQQAPRGISGKYIRVWIPETLLKRITEKQNKLGLATLSEAVRYLLNKGLEEVDK